MTLTCQANKTPQNITGSIAAWQHLRQRGVPTFPAQLLKRLGALRNCCIQNGMTLRCWKLWFSCFPCVSNVVPNKFGHNMYECSSIMLTRDYVMFSQLPSGFLELGILAIRDMRQVDYWLQSYAKALQATFNQWMLDWKTGCTAWPFLCVGLGDEWNETTG